MEENVIIGLNNHDIIEGLKIEGLKIKKVITTQESLFKELENMKRGILITGEGLSGYHSKFSFIKQLRDINVKIKIIFITDESDKEFVDYAKNKNINEILLNSEFIVENITKIIKKYEVVAKEKNLDIEQENNQSLTIFKPQQQIITIAGTEGAGKSTIASHIATQLAKQNKGKVLLIDLDTANGGLNNFFNISPKDMSEELAEKNLSSLNHIVDSIDKKTFSNSLLEKYLIKSKKTKKLYILTGNTSFYVCKSILSEHYYTNIIETAKSLFDYIVIDISSNIFLDSTQFAVNNSNKILFVCNANLVSVERSLKLFNEIYNTWDVDKDKVRIIINRYNKGCLEKEVIKEVFKNYYILDFIPYDVLYEKNLNQGEIRIPKRDIEKYNKITSELTQRKGE